MNLRKNHIYNDIRKNNIFSDKFNKGPDLYTENYKIIFGRNLKRSKYWNSIP